MKYWWWKIRYALLAMRILGCSPAFAWHMATIDESFPEGLSPSEAISDELSYWDDDGD